MSEDYREKLLRSLESLTVTTQELERTIDLIKDSDILDHDTKAKTIAFLEGYRTGLKEQIEWLNCIVSTQ